MPTKEQFKAYEKVRLTGNWNMITDAYNASKEAGLDLETYFEIIKNYSALKEKYTK